MTIMPAWLKDAELQQLFAAINEAGGEGRAVGGCVRDALLGKEGGDVDVASTLPPEKLALVVEGKGWKAVPTGIAHGTLTVVMPSKRPIEVTTLRKDVETDGRHATVAYTDDWQEDAARRDFTINALYMDANGAISDFYRGQKDLKEQVLSFIGNPNRRIEEDGLRILRFFRFLAQLGWKAVPTARAACASHVAMIDDLSGERIQQEMKKLLMAEQPAYALEQMDKIDLPEKLTGSHWELGALKFLLQQEAQHKVASSPWLRLAVMLPEAQRAEAASSIAERWKLSRSDGDVLKYLCAGFGTPDAASVKQWLLKAPREQALWRVLFASARARADYGDMLKLARDWAVPEFPVKARDLNMPEGVELGKKLKELEQRWIESDYRLSKEQLLAD